jgi:hypothetical protein
MKVIATEIEKKPSGDELGEYPEPDRLSLPIVQEVREDEWERHKFDKYSALKALDTGENSYDFFVNMDNAFLRAELKVLRQDVDTRLYEARFKFAMVLIGLALIKNDMENEQPAENEQINSIEENILYISKALAPIVIPMIENLGSLQLDEIES